jgi:hypothetical protein
MSKKNPKWSQKYSELLIKAREKGVINFDMSGKTALACMSQHEEFAIISDNFSHEQVRNAIKRLRDMINPPAAKLKQAKEKMDITNELLPTYGTCDYFKMKTLLLILMVDCYILFCH